MSTKPVGSNSAPNLKAPSISPRNSNNPQQQTKEAPELRTPENTSKPVTTTATPTTTAESTVNTSQQSDSNNHVGERPATLTKNESFAYWREKEQQKPPPPTVNKVNNKSNSKGTTSKPKGMLHYTNYV